MQQYWLALWDHCAEPGTGRFIHQRQPNLHSHQRLPSLQGALVAGSAAVAAAVAGYQFLDVGTKFQLASSIGPFIRTLDAETAHRVGILAARYGLFPRETRPDPESLKVQLWGRTFPNPIGGYLDPGYEW